MGDLVYRCVIAASRAVFRGLGLRIELRGEEHLPTTGGAVLARNLALDASSSSTVILGLLAQASRGGTAPTPEVARVLEDAAMWGTGGASRKAPSAGRDTQMNSG